MRIFLIEDEPELARWVSRSLARHSGFVVEWADDGIVADRRLSLEEFDAVVLDLGLPGMDGHAVLSRMRARDDRTPVLVLTARDSLAERVGSLHGGADDFLPKPFMIEELEARLQALIRRSRGREHPRLACGPLHYDTAAQKFSLDQQVLPLSPREHAVLRALIQRSGEPVKKQQILERVFSDDSDVNLEAIEVLIHRLRKKLTDSGVRITTMRGLGYCLEENDGDPTQP
ncbi:response regulator [Corticimicrobacter populi]|uniref:DNA-binding response regulator n=1 Tax=Corticimicrobacter populi TaxID=2175229 RepID=A0A2V1JYK2_9BURK|nr:response regulator [Corticimicrobacter populi]PWF22192.1 DNA-binding response regulator [Corticimicrobacter populi]QDQ86259.1 response regulator [Alcaligenaceae bacterium SJ-26]